MSLSFSEGISHLKTFIISHQPSVDKSLDSIALSLRYSIISALRFVIVDGKLVHGNMGGWSVPLLLESRIGTSVIHNMLVLG